MPVHLDSLKPSEGPQIPPTLADRSHLGSSGIPLFALVYYKIWVLNDIEFFLP